MTPDDSTTPPPNEGSATRPSREGSSKRWPRLQVVLAFLGVFALGAVTGGALERVRSARGRHAFADGRPGRVEARLAALRRRLDLSSEQAIAIEAILREAEVRREELVETSGLRRHREEVERRIVSVLTDAQRERFQHLVERGRRRGRR